MLAIKEKKKEMNCRCMVLLIELTTWNSLIADIFWSVRDNMRDRELGRGDSLHQIFVLS
jgi:hypothetical protein